MSSVLRELVWLQIQKTPGCSVRQIEAALGKEQGNISVYVLQLWRARKIDRKESFIPTANVSGKTRCFLYTVVGETYNWMTPRAAKAAKAAAKAAKKAVLAGRVPVPEPWKAAQATLHQSVKTDQVDQWIARLPSLPVKDVLKLRKAIDAALTV